MGQFPDLVAVVDGLDSQSKKLFEQLAPLLDKEARDKGWFDKIKDALGRYHS